MLLIHFNLQACEVKLHERGNSVTLKSNWNLLDALQPIIRVAIGAQLDFTGGTRLACDLPDSQF